MYLDSDGLQGGAGGLWRRVLSFWSPLQTCKVWLLQLKRLKSYYDLKVVHGRTDEGEIYNSCTRGDRNYFPCSLTTTIFKLPSFFSCRPLKICVCILHNCDAITLSTDRLTDTWRNHFCVIHRYKGCVQVYILPRWHTNKYKNITVLHDIISTTIKKIFLKPLKLHWNILEPQRRDTFSVKESSIRNDKLWRLPAQMEDKYMVVTSAVKVVSWWCVEDEFRSLRLRSEAAL